jgi:hypothetical protein
MKVNKLIRGENYRYYVDLNHNKMTANIRYFRDDTPIECKISDDLKYIILPSTIIPFNRDSEISIQKLKFNKYQQSEIKDCNPYFFKKAKELKTEILVNPYYQMMIKNAAIYLRSQDPLNPDTLNAFQISEAIAICTCKLKEDVISDIISVKL